MTADEFWAAYDAGDTLARAVATFQTALQLGFPDTDWLPAGPVDNYLGQIA
ncbi:hypothetical protein XA26_45780 [Mycolicibacterium fortuitum]|uniref:Uncharacterized protein n=1 Tax=Mycolicibacterium fortuitum TaxID=1766 RepID=A0A0N9YJT1_MYCFO|nr:hypothetical protein [Mycolicibacterium fortuitum]ALI28378.1 hypothetical protein XA26_45780 [Mycolicibacterium fortuitum]